MDGSTGFIISKGPTPEQSTWTIGGHTNIFTIILDISLFFNFNVCVYAKAVVVCLLFVSFVPRRDTRREEAEEEEGEKMGLYILFCFVYIFIGMDVVVVVRRRFLRPPGSLYSPPPFHFWVLFLKTLMATPNANNKKKEEDRRESRKRPDVLCFFLYFSYVYIDLCIAHTSLTSSIEHDDTTWNRQFLCRKSNFVKIQISRFKNFSKRTLGEITTSIAKRKNCHAFQKYFFPPFGITKMWFSTAAW
jgi:hypothetical protein